MHIVDTIPVRFARKSLEPSLEPSRVLPKTFPYSCIFDIIGLSAFLLSSLSHSLLLFFFCHPGPPRLALLPAAPRNCTCKFIQTSNKAIVVVVNRPCAVLCEDINDRMLDGRSVTIGCNTILDNTI